MVWKPKEKSLSLNEALELATKELRPSWFASEPLLACVPAGDKVTAYPLDPTFPQKVWLIVFVDITTFTGDNALIYVREWFRRYNVIDTNFLIVLRSPYTKFFTTALVEKFMRVQQIKFPVVIDTDGLLSSAFGAVDFPRVILLNKTQTLFNHGRAKLTHSFQETEFELQNFLRSTDPGLPLFLTFRNENEFPSDEYGMEFGRGLCNMVAFEPPAAAPKQGGGRAAPVKVNQVTPGAVFLTGRWEQNAEAISTADSTAQIEFISPAPRIALVVRTTTQSEGISRALVEVNGLPPYEGCLGQDLTVNDDGKTVIRVRSGGLYHILQGLSENERHVTIKFPDAERIRLALYGLRFCK